MKKAIIIVGGGKSQLGLIQAAKKRRYLTFVFDKSANSPGAGAADYFLPINIKNSKLIIDNLRFLKKSYMFGGVLSYSSKMESIKTMIKIATYFHFRIFPSRCFEYLFNKELLFNKLSRHIDIPYFSVVKNAEEIKYSSSGHDFPLIIKPVHGGGSWGVFKVNSKEHLIKLYKEVTKKSKNKDFILQEIIEGKEYSLNGFVYRKKVFLFPIASKFTLGENYGFTHLGYTLLKKNDVDPGLSVKFKDLFEAACKLLQADNYFFASDVIVSNKKVYIIDFGFLLDSKIDRLLLAAGLDVYDMLIDIALGKKPIYDEILLFKQNMYLRFLFANRQGILKVKPDIKSSRHFKFLEWERSDGDIVTPPSSIADAIGWEIKKYSNFNHKDNDSRLFSVV